MSCGHCVSAVSRALEAVDGVTVESVGVGGATVSFDPERADPARIARAVEAQGYSVAPAA